MPTIWRVYSGKDGQSHLEEVTGALTDVQWAIVPGTSHALLWEKPHIANQLILDFLADEQAPKFF